MPTIVHHFTRNLSSSAWVLILLPTLILLRAVLCCLWYRSGRTRLAALLGLRGPARELTGFRASLMETLGSAIFALGLVFLVIRPFVVQPYYIPSASMEETLQIQDKIVVNKLAYALHPPQRGDVVVFEPPSIATPDTQDDWIKRVIGLPGDHIAVHNDHLYRNGKIQKEPYVTLLDPASDQPGTQHLVTGQYTYTFPLEGKDVVVPPGKLFVMGDNRNNSDDGHVWGFLDQHQVVGRAEAIWWPLTHARMLTPAR